MIDKDQVRLSRIARRVNDSLIEGHRKCKAEAVSSSGLVTESLEEVLKIRRRFAWADERRMQVAKTSQFDQLVRLLRGLSCQIDSIQARLAEVQQDPKQLTVAETLAELTQLETEFDQQVVFELGNQTLSVTTEPIELEGVFLGAFTIQLKLARLRDTSHSRCYSVIADEPNPASGNDHVTHPHVSHDEMCEGDAGTPIRAALAQGRLCDFFILVRSVLQTYNPESPYIRLDEWDGTPCHDCGTSMCSDETYFCEVCEHDFCSDCMSSCHVCGESSCRECLETCPSCDEHVCDRCLTTCDKCGKSMCKNCLEKCPACGNKVCDDCLTTCEDCDRPALRFAACRTAGVRSASTNENPNL